MIYESVKKLCDKRNISVSNLEKRVGLGNGTIQKWRTCNPTVKTLEKVAEELGVTVGYLIEK